MAEAGGRAVERKIVLPVVPNGNMVGVKPLFAGRSLADGAAATFDVMLVAPDGKTLAKKGARYELLKVESRYQWYRRDNAWDWESIKSTRRVADGKIDLVAGKPARRLEVHRFGAAELRDRSTVVRSNRWSNADDARQAHECDPPSDTRARFAMESQTWSRGSHAMIPKLAVTR